MKIDLNADMGESFGAYVIGDDEAVLAHISSANIACGWHASDPVVMQKTVRLAKRHGTAIGAHPGYPDLMGFGRRSMSVTPEEASAYTLYQIGALNAFAHAEGARLEHVKPHGALYNSACADIKLARAVCNAIAKADGDLIVLGRSNSSLEQAAREMSLAFAGEVFADRAYEDDGSLAPRARPGAIIDDEELIVERVLTMIKRGTVTSVNGKTLDIKAQSVCIHGDNPKSLLLAKRLCAAFAEENISIAPLREMLS